MKKQTEGQLQVAVARLLDSLGLDWFHVPNGGNRNARTGGILKKQGVKAGVPDVLILNRSGNLRGVAIELKVGKNKMSEAQVKWGERFACNGWRWAVCYNIDEVIDVLKGSYPERFAK